MRDMIQISVNEALTKRKEDREKKKHNQNKKGDNSNDSKADLKMLIFGERVKELEEQFKIHEQEKAEMERKLKEYE